MEIIVLNKRVSPQTIKNNFHDSYIIDVTSNSNDEFVKFSPFYPHGNIPVPFSDGHFAQTVEGIWQGLKVFENCGIDISKFYISNMKNIKRSVRKFGKVLGHQKGINSEELYNYYEARMFIYIPSYKWILSNKLKDSLALLKDMSESKPIIMLDYETNLNVLNTSKPLSHAGLIKNYLENNCSFKF